MNERVLTATYCICSSTWPTCQAASGISYDLNESPHLKLTSQHLGISYVLISFHQAAIQTNTQLDPQHPQHTHHVITTLSSASLAPPSPFLATVSPSFDWQLTRLWFQQPNCICILWRHQTGKREAHCPGTTVQNIHDHFSLQFSDMRGGSGGYTHEDIGESERMYAAGRKVIYRERKGFESISCISSCIGEAEAL